MRRGHLGLIVPQRSLGEALQDAERQRGRCVLAQTRPQFERHDRRSIVNADLPIARAADLDRSAQRVVPARARAVPTVKLAVDPHLFSEPSRERAEVALDPLPHQLIAQHQRGRFSLLEPTLHSSECTCKPLDQFRWTFDLHGRLVPDSFHRGAPPRACQPAFLSRHAGGTPLLISGKDVRSQLALAAIQTPARSSSTNASSSSARVWPESVGLQFLDDRYVQVFYANVMLGFIDAQRAEYGLVRPKVHRRKV